jgi:ABC-type lipoprotein release transport system permease subunit
MVLLIFFLGALLGVLIGGALCVRYLRQEIAGNIGPRLNRIQLQIDTLESAVNLALVTRQTEIPPSVPRQPDAGV